MINMPENNFLFLLSLIIKHKKAWLIMITYVTDCLILITALETIAPFLIKFLQLKQLQKKCFPRSCFFTFEFNLAMLVQARQTPELKTKTLKASGLAFLCVTGQRKPEVIKVSHFH